MHKQTSNPLPQPLSCHPFLTNKTKTPQIHTFKKPPPPLILKDSLGVMSLQLARPKENNWQLTWAVGRHRDGLPNCLAILTMLVGEGREKRLFPTQGLTRGPGPRTVLPALALLPLVKGSSCLIVHFGLHEMRWCRVAAAHGPSPPALAPMAAASGLRRAPL